MQKLRRANSFDDVQTSPADFAIHEEIQVETKNQNLERERFIRLPETLSRVGLSRSKVYNLISEGSFPAPQKIGRSALWLESEVQQWIRDVLQNDEEVAIDEKRNEHERRSGFGPACRASNSDKANRDNKK